jgi:peroxiredoxin
MIEIGTQAPSFSLPEPASGNQVCLSDYSGKPLLVVFSCNHCPYVLHIIRSFTEFANAAQHRGLGVAMISSSISGRLHAGFLFVRCVPSAGLSGAV